MPDWPAGSGLRRAVRIRRVAHEGDVQAALIATDVDTRSRSAIRLEALRSPVAPARMSPVSKVHDSCLTS